MKILHLSTSDIEQGAARAAYRLHCGLRKIGLDSEMLVRSKLTIDSTVTPSKSLVTKLCPPLNSLPTKLYTNRDRDVFSPQWFPDKIIAQAQQNAPDLINLHWITNGFVQIENLRRLTQPLVWTLHDMWAFTGGCHYSRSCQGYQSNCGQCLHLQSKQSWDLSRWIWQRKATHWQNLNLTVVSPSQWLADCASKSSLFQDRPIEVIPHGLNTQVYTPRNRHFAREILNLPQNKKLVLFGAVPGLTTGSRKGIQYLLPAIEKLSSWYEDEIELVIFGADKPEKPDKFSFKVHYLGRFQDDISLSLVYSSADVMVVPSVQEAFGQTASESLACGTPVVAFAATGLKDIVEHQVTGYLAKPFEVKDLAEGIKWILTNSDRYEQLCLAARQKAEREFSLTVQASRYRDLFNKLLHV